MMGATFKPLSWHMNRNYCKGLEFIRDYFPSAPTLIISKMSQKDMFRPLSSQTHPILDKTLEWDNDHSLFWQLQEIFWKGMKHLAEYFDLM